MPRAPASPKNDTEATGTGLNSSSRNARAQARHRAKRKAYIDSLEDTVAKLQAALTEKNDVPGNPGSSRRVSVLEEENVRLRAEIERLKAQVMYCCSPRDCDVFHGRRLAMSPRDSSPSSSSDGGASHTHGSKKRRLSVDNETYLAAAGPPISTPSTTSAPSTTLDKTLATGGDAFMSRTSSVGAQPPTNPHSSVIVPHADGSSPSTSQPPPTSSLNTTHQAPLLASPQSYYPVMANDSQQYDSRLESNKHQDSMLFHPQIMPPSYHSSPLDMYSAPLPVHSQQAAVDASWPAWTTAGASAYATHSEQPLLHRHPHSLTSPASYLQPPGQQMYAPITHSAVM